MCRKPKYYFLIFFTMTVHYIIDYAKKLLKT
jgi:hypothetical protein